MTTSSVHSSPGSEGKEEPVTPQSHKASPAADAGGASGGGGGGGEKKTRNVLSGLLHSIPVPFRRSESDAAHSRYNTASILHEPKPPAPNTKRICILVRGKGILRMRD